MNPINPMNPMNPTNPINPINPTNPINQNRSKKFLITIDVEDWFQVENFKPWIPFETWGRRELRIERNVHRLLDMFDTISLAPSPIGSIKSTNALFSVAQSSTSRLKATFFVLGWVAEKVPHLVREIIARGHEVASHGCRHDLPLKMSINLLRKDLADSRKKLEAMTGKPIIGFRAPSFSIDDKILRSVAEAGYTYDSSFNSFCLNRRYGRVSVNGRSKKGIARKISGNFYELPISNLDMKHLTRAFFSRYGKNINGVNSIENFLEATSKWGLVLPWGGGGYFRLIPNNLFKAGVEAILNEDGVYIFYIHPWEIDPDQPRIKNLTFSRRFRHYANLQETEGKLMEMVERFGYCEFMTCSEYVSRLESGK